MSRFEKITISPPVNGSGLSPAYPISVIGEERVWRAPPPQHATMGSRPKAIATRWHAVSEQTQEFFAETPDDCHIFKLVLRRMNIRFEVAGRTVHDRVAMPGMFHVTTPAAPVRCVFRGSYDILHLHVPNKLIAECADEIPGIPIATLSPMISLSKDSVIERLGHSLLAADQIGGPLGYLYGDSINTAVVARLLASTNRAAPCERPRIAELSRWRLKRAMDYFEEHLAESMSTADVATAVGLTPMHFAAQFRAATGLRPHEYLLRRRIERAQELLARTSMSVADVALSVGFQAQSHFTIVFSRFVGQPPQTWRRWHDLATART
ncbi:MAG TPA: AraC family transcriptional regulator [Roseiarcus sp.]|nr:AraC family transcriptional regulator [Roseiarcus sp.]